MCVDLRSLSAFTILNTRPEAQAGELTQLLEQHGARVIEQPLIEITGVTDTLNNGHWLHELKKTDIIIFISANAVTHFIQWVAAMRVQADDDQEQILSESLQIATVGHATAKVLQRESKQQLGKRISVDIVPEHGSDSESLLKHPRLSDCSETNILIVRGCGGREYLAEQLRQRGAKVDYLEVYRRSVPDFSQAEQQAKLLDIWCHNKIDYMIITSSEGLVNLLTILGGALQHSNLKENQQGRITEVWPLVAVSKILVVHQKIAAKARELGLRQQIIVAGKANNEAILKALIRSSLVKGN